MDEKTNLNATCSICGSKYHRCDTCAGIKSFEPWRTLVDTKEHYKIFLIIRDYTNKYMDKEEAKTLLSDCDLTGLDGFVLEIKNVINDIMSNDNTETAIKESAITDVISTESDNVQISKKKR